MFAGLRLTHHEKEPGLPIATAGGTNGSFQNLLQDLVGNGVGLQAPHGT